MKQKIWLLTVGYFLLCVQAGKAGVLPAGVLPAGVLPAGVLPSSHYKYQQIEAVCRKIVAARAVAVRFPALVVYSRDDSRQVIAQFKNAPVPTLYVDEKLYDLARRFGRDSLNALACVMGHELAHYFRKHTWENGFTGLIDGSGGAGISKAEKIKTEAEADKDGLFYGFLAGYETYKLLPALLDAIYKEYHLPDQMVGYPDRTERIAIARDNAAEIEQLAGVFSSGEFLYLSKHYEEATEAFEFILQKLPARDVYNNLGSIRLMQALAETEQKQSVFAYPCEFDAKGRLRNQRNRSLDVLREKENISPEKEWLRQAKAHFKQAMAIDGMYSSAYINLSCVYVLEGNYELAIGTINELETLLGERSEVLPGNAHTIRGIARMSNQQPDKAKTDFEAAMHKNSYMSRYNMAVFENLSASWTDKMYDWLTEWPTLEKWMQNENSSKVIYVNPHSEKIANLATQQLPAQEFGREISVTTAKRAFKVARGSGSDAEKLRLRLFDRDIYLIYTGANYTGTSFKGIKQGATTTQVIEKYGTPTYIRAGSTGEFYIYEKTLMIIKLQNNTVQGWMLYRTEYR